MPLLNVIEILPTKLLNIIYDYVTNKKNRGSVFLCVPMTTICIVFDYKNKYGHWGVSSSLSSKPRGQTNEPKSPHHCSIFRFIGLQDQQKCRSCPKPIYNDFSSFTFFHRKTKPIAEHLFSAQR